MKIVILAAGRGSRLGGHDFPKALTLLSNKKSILEMQLEHIASFTSLRQVVVVVGYKEEKIINRFPELEYVENPDFETTNTAKSLLLALQLVKHEPLIWINGDVVFHRNVFESVYKSGKTGMVVNVGRVGEEEVKYRTDGKGRILEVSKNVASPEGEALGLNIFSEEDVDMLRDELIRCQPNDYFEKAVEMCIEDGMTVYTIPVNIDHCVEVDFPEDLVLANKMLQRWK